ncbi:hypothetical protein GPECTOR_3g237 [Gonium pectorale]|uniref:CDK5RAP3-like protein n=1 Tax=Gonium pectorale TaxID=33097 RepID=A0A150GZ21_GONPE|nr:hypothetical protein GPECTOR_3g237 [Gonium pectorale]|eukprot:KXZ55081.1 hypothetical protein GPECTOR_3g237 [Gonium pectorale]
MSEPSIARLIGEGVERPEASLPLDINYAKLTEWLVTRQKIPKDWHKRLQVIQAKAAEALKEVPSEVLNGLTDGSDASVDYLRAVEIRDKLASTSERTMFGGLSGPAGTWDKIVKAYEKQYVYLGECGQALVQAVDFDIPAQRRQAARLGQQMQDCDRKQAECIRNAAACAAKYKEECKKLGIQGVAVRQELRALASELPGMLRQVVDCLHDPALQAAGEYYAAFSRFAHGPREARSGAAAASPSLAPADMLPTLFEIRERQTQPPAEAAEPEASSQQGPGTAAGGIDIDWDVGGAGAEDDGAAAAAMAAGGEAGGSGGGVVEIDWDFALAADDAGGGVDTGGAGGEGGGINWDIDVSAPDAAGDGSAAGDGGAAAAGPITIDWDIAVDSAGDTAAAGTSSAAAAAGDGGAAQVAEAAGGRGCGSSTDPDDVAAARLERDGEYRARLMDDLLELRAFLAMRKAELGGGGELLSTALPDSVSSVDASAVAAMLGALGRALSQLASPRFRQLLLIATSKRYLDRLEASLQRQAGAEAKLLRAAEDTSTRRREAAASLAASGPRTAALVARTRRLKALAERGVSATLGGKRTVNVLGEINNVLAAGS